MTRNNNFCVLPFYEDIREQNHRLPYAFGEVYALLTPKQYILPFQVQGITGANLTIRLYDRNGNYIANITQALRETGLYIVNNIAVYVGRLPLSVNIPEGQYYISLSDGQKIWYSDIFTEVSNTDSLLKIEWWDIEPLQFDDGEIIYGLGTGYKNKVYLQADLSRPDYKFTEEAEERDGFNFPLKMISEKVYKFVFLAPEYLLDAMRFIRLSDYVEITDRYGRKYKPDSFLITPKWQTQATLASVDAEFETNTAVKKVGKGFVSRETGDFNDDFNDDFLAENV